MAKSKRGFAAMKNRVKQRKISKKGGKAVHKQGTGHEWTSEEARKAGLKGGPAPHINREYVEDPLAPVEYLPWCLKCGLIMVRSGKFWKCKNRCK